GPIANGGHDFSEYFGSLAPQIQSLRDLVVRSTPKDNVRLGDVSNITDTTKERDGLVRHDGQDGIARGGVKLPDANVISVVDAVKKKMDVIEPRLPANTHLDMVIDGSRYTTSSFTTVRNALLEAVLVTGLILLVFLHTWRSTLIVLVSIPVSL